MPSDPTKRMAETLGAKFLTDTQAPDVVVTEAPVDGGFDGASVEAAETLWACLPHVRKWTSLATHEKALVIHTFARLSTQSAMQARIEELEAENDRLSKAVGSGILRDLLNDEEQDEFVKFIKFLRGSAEAQAVVSNIGGEGK